MKRFLIFASMIFIIVSNTTEIFAKDMHKIYFLEKTEEEKLLYKEYFILGEVMEEEKIKLMLNTLLYNTQDKINYIPEGTKVLNVKLINNNLFINFNENIENYGGNHYEINLIKQILYTCFDFENIQNVTFLINGKFKLLPEGRLIFKYTRQDLDNI